MSDAPKPPLPARTDSTDSRFSLLKEGLDELLAELNGQAHGFFSKQNVLVDITPVVLILKGDTPVACGAFRPKSSDTAEIKRMFVLPEHRGQGLSRMILIDLERWAIELGHSTAVLETSKRLTAAVGLYQSHGYQLIPNFPPYEDQHDSVCYQKSLQAQN